MILGAASYILEVQKDDVIIDKLIRPSSNGAFSELAPGTSYVFHVRSIDDKERISPLDASLKETTREYKLDLFN